MRTKEELMILEPKGLPATFVHCEAESQSRPKSAPLSLSYSGNRRTNKRKRKVVLLSVLPDTGSTKRFEKRASSAKKRTSRTPSFADRRLAGNLSQMNGRRPFHAVPPDLKRNLGKAEPF